MKNTDKLNRYIFIKDNLEVLRSLDDKSVDLIYLDPPFNSNKQYNAPIGTAAEGASFKDVWTLEDTDDAWWGELADKEPALYSAIHAVGIVNGDKDKAYLIYMAMRLLELKRLLKNTGSIYLHCDQTMSHSLKLVMDSVFGKKNFKNEIIWDYSGNSTSDNFFPKKHDTLLFYSKNELYTFNKVYRPYAPATIKRYNHEDKHGRFKISTLNGKTEKVYMKKEGCQVQDVWSDCPIVRKKEEKTGHPTQKPRVLLERIIEASSNEGDLVLDPFCGCATTCVASENIKRKWIGIDLSPKAGDLVKLRLKKELGYGRDKLKNIRITDKLPFRDAPKPSKDIKHRLYGLQQGYCKGCKVHFEFRHFHKDHIVPKAKGGQDTDKNLQLLCGSCNSIKGDRDMASLKARLKNIYPVKKAS